MNGHVEASVPGFGQPVAGSPGDRTGAPRRTVLTHTIADFRKEFAHVPDVQPTGAVPEAAESPEAVPPMQAIRDVPPTQAVQPGEAAVQSREAQDAAGVRDAARVRDVRAASPGDRQSPLTAVVMTMGALHEGHATLIRTARRHIGEQGRLAVTVFVNPLQFGPGEDLDRYPRTLDADLAVCEETGADVVFAPSAQEVYPEGQPQVLVAAGPMGERLEGASRPGHFDGVLTVVLKLLHITRPDVAFFGQKDAQQLALIRRMVADLNMDVDVVAVPTVREPDGLALSSRNRYLSADERTVALALSRALQAGGAAVPIGPDGVRAAARQVLEAAGGSGLDLDYLALVDPLDFTDVPAGHRGRAVLAVAARVGSTRLIDNIPLEFGRSHA